MNVEEHRRYNKIAMRKRRLALIESQPEIIETGDFDPRSKQECILCATSIRRSLYIENGNFCTNCLARIAELATAYPQEPPDIRQKDFKDRYERWRGRKEEYDRMSKRFQQSCRDNKKLKHHEIK